MAARVIGAALDLPMRVVYGYAGTAGIRAAAERGEVAGGCWGWDSIRATWADGLARGEVRVVVQAVSKRLPDLPDVPTVPEVARTEEGKQLAKVLEDLGSMMRPFALPPGTPKSQVAVLRSAFMSTMADRDFLREAEKLGLDIDPLDGRELEGKVADLFERKELLAKLKRVLDR